MSGSTTARRLTAALLLTATIAASALPRAAEARSLRRDPRITVSAGRLSRALSCTAQPRHARRDPILLVPGTTLDPSINFGWNYERAFDHLGWPWCALTLPDEAMGNAIVAAQYVVYAIRTMHAESHRRVDLLGYSQGGMLPRWSLKYWPSLRRDVNDYVAIDPSNHGTVDAITVCLLRCAPAIWQQRDHSAFLNALNRGPETWPGISYTVIYSHADEVVVPNLSANGSSSLHTGRGRIRNIAVQSICRLDLSDHLAMGTYDPVAYDLAIDAFTHRGPAKPGRVPRSVCRQAFMPGVVAAKFAADYAKYLAHVTLVLATAKQTSSEPTLPRYAR